MHSLVHIHSYQVEQDIETRTNHPILPCLRLLIVQMTQETKVCRPVSGFRNLHPPNPKKFIAVGPPGENLQDPQLSLASSVV